MFKFFKNVSQKIKNAGHKVFSFAFPDVVDEASLKSVEDAFYSADFGTEVTNEIIEEIKRALRQNRSLRRENVIDIASLVLKKCLAGAEAELNIRQGELQVICLVGTNGCGKTTTAAKLAYFYKDLGKSVIFGACDTFRAAANEQLNSWGERLSIDVVSSQHGGDPAAVAFDAHKAAVARQKDVLILDTAGRLHVKSNLMAELQKILRTLKKHNPNLPINTWLVVDGTIGANSIKSAEIFHDEIGLTGCIITKLDNTSIGGTLVGIYRKLSLPIYFVGTGEDPNLLEKFSVEKYVSRIFAEP
jgi:fused signal recognition particle receptor